MHAQAVSNGLRAALAQPLACRMSAACLPVYLYPCRSPASGWRMRIRTMPGCLPCPACQVREEELPELAGIGRAECPHEVRGGGDGKGAVETKEGKVNALMQAWVSRARIESFSLTADMLYVSSNAPRIMRAVFEIALRCVHARAYIYMHSLIDWPAPLGRGWWGR